VPRDRTRAPRRYGCGKDDDCNGKIDDGLDYCADPQNCGACGNNCALPHVAVAGCATSASTGESCNVANTHCVISQCDAGWADSNGNWADGCEAGTTTGPSGPEICDGYDNDGDGYVDEPGAPPGGTDGTADPLVPTRHLGDPCGSDVGECRLGSLICREGDVVCGNGVSPMPEICDGKDNDCDGQTDEEPAAGEPPVCGSQAMCVKVGQYFECASPCGSGEFPCPTGFVCNSLSLSANPATTVNVCVAM